MLQREVVPDRNNNEKEFNGDDGLPNDHDCSVLHAHVLHHASKGEGDYVFLDDDAEHYESEDVRVSEWVVPLNHFVLELLENEQHVDTEQS